MPVATSSRRRIASSASPQAGPSRHQQPSNPRHAGNSENGEDGEDGDDMEEEEGWTKDTFVNQPIDKNSTALVNLRTISDKIRDVIVRIDEGVVQAKETAFAIEDAGEDDEAIARMEKVILQALDQRALLQIKIEVMDQLSRQLREGKAFNDIEREYKVEAEKREAEYMGKSQRAKYKKVKEYIDFRQHLWSINHSSACPPISQWLDKGPEDDSSDDDIDVGGQTQNYRCPITLMLYQDVVTSPKCGHSYSRAAIEDQISALGRRRATARCPITGCSATLERTDLKPNPTLQKRADEFDLRRRRREEEQDEGDETLNIDEDDIDL